MMKNRLRWPVMVLLVAVVFALPVLAQDVTLTAVKDDVFGFNALVPEGWSVAGPGLRARGASPGDVTLVALQSGPFAADQALSSLLPQLGLTSPPEPVGSRETDTLTWTVYKIDVKAGATTIIVDLALAENEGKTYLILLQTNPDEYDGLHESVFLPMVDSLTVLAEPVENVPYAQEDVSFTNGDTILWGTLTLPEGAGPHPALVLVSGSGAQDRDESLGVIAAIKPFRLIADALTRQGIAVLRYDDRGTGESGGDFASATLADFADDAAAAIDYLLTRDEINPEQIGLLGHSEGGAVAAILAAGDHPLAFVISMAGLATGMRELSLYQNAHSLELQGFTSEATEAMLVAVNAAFDLVLADKAEEAEEVIYQATLALFQSLPEDQQKAIGDLEAAARQSAQQQRGVYTSPWLKFWLSYEPAADWAKVKIPVLAIFGGLDTQVLAETNAPPLEAALKEAGNSDVTIITLPSANHLMQDAVTGELDEYGTLKQEFTADFLPTLSAWILERVTVSPQ